MRAILIIGVQHGDWKWDFYLYALNFLMFAVLAIVSLFVRPSNDAPPAAGYAPVAQQLPTTDEVLVRVCVLVCASVRVRSCLCAVCCCLWHAARGWICACCLAVAHYWWGIVACLCTACVRVRLCFCAVVLLFVAAVGYLHVAQQTDNVLACLCVHVCALVCVRACVFVCMYLCHF